MSVVLMIGEEVAQDYGYFEPAVAYTLMMIALLRLLNVASPHCVAVVYRFAIIIFASDWVGVDVFGGDPSTPGDDNNHKVSLTLAARNFVNATRACHHLPEWSV